jgi:HEAT repeat protein
MRSIHKLPALFVLLAIITPVYPFNLAQLNAQEREEWEQLIKRFNEPRTFNLLTGKMWSLTHGGDVKKVEEILNLLTVLDPTSGRRPAITTKEFKNRIAAFLESDDDQVASFAATLLAIMGDLSYAPLIAKLLDKQDPPTDPERFVHDITSRGAAAYALSVLGAREYVPKVALMLKSKNDYDRAGATSALAEFKATEYADDIAELLKSESGMLVRDDSPIYALMEMGVGAKYAAEFVRIVHDNPDRDVTQTAVFALAKLGGKEHAKEIARLLVDTYLKEGAAVALAIMGATEYTDQIAGLLKDKDNSVRMGALSALGIMRAKKYEQQIARHLKDPDLGVHLNAAFALVLMDADRYAKTIVPMVQHLYRDNLNLVESQPFVEEELQQINNRFRSSFERMKKLRAPNTPRQSRRIPPAARR